MAHRLSNDQASLLNKLLAVLFGIIATGLAFMAPLLGGIIEASASIYRMRFVILLHIVLDIQATFSITGGLFGPLIGLFFLGVFYPRATRVGSLAAFVVACIISCALTVGIVVEKAHALHRQVEPFISVLFAPP